MKNRTYRRVDGGGSSSPLAPPGYPRGARYALCECLACLPATTMKVRGDYIKRGGLRDNKKDDGLQEVIKNYKDYRGIHNNI